MQNWKAIGGVLIALALWFLVVQPILTGGEMFGGLLSSKKE
jgi:hypothetical protein